MAAAPPLPRGLQYARFSGLLAGGFLLVWGIGRLCIPHWAPLMPLLQAGSVLMVTYGVVLLLPWRRVTKRRSRLILAGLMVVLSVGFVFLQIIEVIVAYSAAAERGERLGVPGFQSALVFLALMQLPILLFIQNPEQLD